GRVDALPGRRDQDVDGGLVAVDEGVESLVDQVVEGDAAGDEGGEVDLAALDELDHGRVVVDVPDRPAQIDLLHHELVHVEVRAVAPDRDVQQHAGGAQRIHQGVQHHLHAGGLERDVRALAVGQGADLLGHVDLGRITGCPKFLTHPSASGVNVI